MAYQMEGINIPEWTTIKSYFRAVDRAHMLSETNGNLDLWNCNDVKQWGAQIYAKVSSGAMPPGGPAWTGDMIADFYSWWKQGTCP